MTDDQQSPRVIDAGIQAESGDAEVQIGQTPEITFTYREAQGMRTSHADGTIGGPTAQGYVSLMFFSERQTLPNEQRFAIEDGKIGKQLSDERIGNGITRQIEHEVIMSVDIAERLHEWLGRQVKRLQEMTGGS